MTTLKRCSLGASSIALSAALIGCGASPLSDTPENSDPSPSSQESRDPEAEPLPSGRSGAPRPGLKDPSKVDHEDIGEVNKAALTAMWTHDTVIDESQHDATVRSIPYATPEYAQQIKKTPQRSAPGAEWERWASHKAFTKVSLSPANDADAPKDTKRDVYRTWTVNITPHSDDGWTGDTTEVTAFVHLQKVGDEWKVRAVQVQ